MRSKHYVSQQRFLEPDDLAAPSKQKTTPPLDVEDGLDHQQHRRHFLHQACISLLAATSPMALTTHDDSMALAASTSSPPSNPLNLKGSFWETGELYDKSKLQPVSYEPEDILQYLQYQVKTLKSLEDYVVDGNFSQLSKLLRGGVMSETQLRKQSYALVDQLPDEDENPNTYLASDALRVFLNSWDNLDRLVDGASKNNIGGVAETLGLALVSPYNAANQVARIASSTGSGSSSGASSLQGNDARILVLDALNVTTKNLEQFITLSKKALSL